MRGQRVIKQLLLLFALLAGQHFALVHAVTHIPHREAAGSNKESGLPHSKLCAQCLLSSHLAQALTSSAPTPPSIALAPPEGLPVRGSRIAASVLGFRSRAPPAPL
jgi:hypothetical protein